MTRQRFETPDRRTRIDRRGVVRAGGALAGAVALLRTPFVAASERLA